MKIYTKTGDDGTTGLFGGARVPKASRRVEAYGTVDELNAVIGWVRSVAPKERPILKAIQNCLFTLGSEIACVAGKEQNLKIELITEKNVESLESEVDANEAVLEPLREFILPGGGQEAAAIHVARTVCRRAERAVLAVDDPPVRPVVVHYLNRLSDFLFVLARRANHDAGVADVPWQK